MAVSDQKFLPSSAVVVQTVDLALDAVVATSQTNRVIRVFKPGHRFLLLPAEVYARSVTAAISFSVGVVNEDGIVFGDPTLAINAVPERFQTAAFVYAVGGVVAAKASTAGAGLTFSAAHQVTALKYGAILVQMDAAGTVSTKVVDAVQAFDSAALALSSLPAPDAGNIALGSLVIEAGAAAWDANTDDLTPGSDLVAVTYVDAATLTPAVNALVPVAGASTYSPVPSAPAAEGSKDAVIVAAYTTDGTGDVADGFLRLRYRPVPLNGEA